MNTEMNQNPKKRISFIAGDWNMFAVEYSDYDSHAISLFKKCIFHLILLFMKKRLLFLYANYLLHNTF
jgi:hypothetical protein